MKVQEIYENALALIGKTEEGTDYDFMNRVPYLLNSDIRVLNTFREEDDQIPLVQTVASTLDVTTQEAQGLALCLACVVASETTNFPENRLAMLYKQRANIMGGVTTGMEEITETVGVS